MAIETHFITTDKRGDTEYRLIPNPDGEGSFADGAALFWRNKGEDKWTGYFHVAPECLADFAEMFARAAHLSSRSED